MQLRIARLSVAAVVLASIPSPAQTAAPGFFQSQIKPLLDRNCIACHNAKVKQGGLDVSTREALLRGSEHGPVIAPGDPENSQFYKLVAHISEPGMPFKGKKLPEDAIQKFAQWIRDGAPYGDAIEDADAAYAAEAAKHWAFRKPVKPAIPTNAPAEWAVHPVDAFIAAGQAKAGVKPLPEANRATLIRRAYLDLTGLPPSDAAVRAFEQDKSPKAWEALIDRLLASPQYGEQWGRHWLDIWRYSDWYGYRKSGQVRYSQKHIWRWRDWTVESLNQNKPYSQMIVEMLAGDEVAPGNPDVARATGYLARSWYRFNRNVWLQDTVEYTSTAFLGITLKCARCHNHKYDPIPQTDYYRFRAIFEPHDVRTDRMAGEADIEKDGLARVYDADLSKPTYRFVRGNEATPDTSVILQPGVPVLFGKTSFKPEPVQLPVEAYFPDGRSFVPHDLLAQARAKVEKAEADLKKAEAKPEAPALVEAARKRLEAARADVPALEARIAADLAAMATPAPPNAEALAEEARKKELAANLLHAEAQLIAAHYEFDQGKEKGKVGGALAKLDSAVKSLREPAEGYTPIGPKYPVTSSGRRLALARWMTSNDNPLTARVAMNHIWLRHFGKALTPTVFNFGRSGKEPSNPELLDWLAVEFMERGWDMKAMHKLLMTSRAYRTESSGWAADAPQAKADPDNLTLWRMNVRRMSAENVRDSLLAISGKLDPAMGGPEIDETKGQEIYRRSLYFRHTPDLQMDMLRVFDAASPIECFERGESIVPQQALALSNSKLSQDAARAIAEQIPASGAQYVDAIFVKVLGRPATADERKESLQFLADQTAYYKGDAARAKQSLAHVLLNHNDFVTIR